MQPNFQFVADNIWHLKREYGTPSVIYSVGDEVYDTQTGQNYRPYTRYPISNSILLPVTIARQVLGGPRGAEPVSGTDTIDTFLIVDYLDLPNDFQIKLEDFIIIDNKRYNIVDIEDIEVNVAAIISLKHMEGQAAPEFINVQVFQTLQLFQTATGVKDEHAASNNLVLTQQATYTLLPYSYTAKVFVSVIPDGTAPMQVTSQTVVANFNADFLDGEHGAFYLDGANFTGTSWVGLTSGNDTSLHHHDTRYYTKAEVDGLVVGDHNHDDLYYTETEIDNFFTSYYTISQVDSLLTGYSQTGHTHDDRYYTETEIDNFFTSYYTSAQVDSLLTGYSQTSHTHDDRYYTETEIDALFGDYYTSVQVDSLLTGYSQTGHTHDDRYYTETETDALFSSHTSNIVEGRLTLTSGVPVTDNVIGVSTLYFTPYKGNRIRGHDGTDWKIKTFSEVSLTLTITNGTNYDVYIDWDTLTLSLVQWTNNTTPASRAFQDNIYVLSGDTTKLLIGSIRASGTNTTENSMWRRFVSNLYNPVTYDVIRIDTTNSWTYNTNAYRPANNSTANRFEYIACTNDHLVTATVYGLALNNTATYVGVGIGIDSTIGNSAQILVPAIASGSITATLIAVYKGRPGLGYHYVQWLEIVNAAGTATAFYGDNTTSNSFTQTGLYGTVMA